MGPLPKSMDANRYRPYFRAHMTASQTSPVKIGAIAVWEDAFSPAEVATLTGYGDGLMQQKAAVVGRAADTDAVRITDVAWIDRRPQATWLYSRLDEIVLRLNEMAFRFELYGLMEKLQYTVYRGAEGGHYNWHVDQGGEPIPEQRKISLSVQLSDTHSYEGCELELVGREIITASRKPGTVIAFPSYVLHRVTPITQGTRKSLVAWVSGPDFR
jgi:PKHD-type hydroxylase